MERHVRFKNLRSAPQIREMFDSCIPVAWRGLKLSQISRKDVEVWHHRTLPASRLTRAGVERTRETRANRALAMLGSVFNRAREWGFFDGENPAAGIERFREQARECFLTREEFARLNAALLQEPNIYWRAFFRYRFSWAPGATNC